MSNEELVIRIKAGIDTADNMLALWQQNRLFIHAIAKHYQGNAELDDLEQEGYLALYDAVDGYDPEYGCKFLTYAEHWIKQRMVRYIQNDSIVHIPVYEQQRQREYNKLVNKYKTYYGRKPTQSEIAHDMGISIKQLALLEKSIDMKRLGSLDSLLTTESDCNVGDTIPSSDNVEMEILDRMELIELKKTIWKVVDTLPERQSEVLRLRFLHEKTLEETGKALGVTGARVRIIQERAMIGMRKNNRAERLRPFLSEKAESIAYKHNGVGEFNRTWTSSTELAALLGLQA